MTGSPGCVPVVPGCHTRVDKVVVVSVHGWLGGGLEEDQDWVG